jgi:solute carrier family 13 (sodium-dependent dicarboxylate transporter), member 2/3/5
VALDAHQRIGLALGAVVCAALLVAPAPAGFSLPAWRTAAVTALMAIWWATEAIPIAATALVPLALLPLLGVDSIEAIARPYANSTIFLILGGFLVALAMERWSLHRRIAFNIVARAGPRPRAMILGFMVASALLSMWVSNTSTTLMMLPVALSVAEVVEPPDSAPASRRGDARAFNAALMLGVAYAASIGGLGTLIGTPTNAIAVAFLRAQYGTDIGFAEWLAFGLPTVCILLPVAWWLLVRVAFRFDLGADDASRRVVRDALSQLGRITRAERRVAILFIVLAALWITRPWLAGLPGLGGLNDAGIGVAAGLALFLIPAGGGTRLLEAADLRRVPWDVLLLFGGGLSLAAAIDGSGLSARIGESLAAVGNWPWIGIILAVVGLVILWTELTSNVATVSTFLPIVAAVAAATHYSPAALIVPAAMAGTCAFMLPVATPPNAIVYGTGRVAMGQMVRAGIWLNVAATVLLCLLATLALHAGVAF